MWRSKAGALLLLAWTAGAARAEICLPPFIDDGSRLYGPEGAQVLWLEPLLRQHEVCWRRPQQQGEKRVFVFGNSSVLGYPLSSAESAVGLVNKAFAARGVTAHLFNLGMPWTYGPKDALVLRHAQAYRPDVIVYSVTLDDFYHDAPMGFAPLDAFFRQNSDLVDRFAAQRPPGLHEPLERYGAFWANDWPLQPIARHLRQCGSVARVGAAQLARRVRSSWFPDMPYEASGLDQPDRDYDCSAVVKRFDMFWKDWRDWSLLPYLAQLQRSTGVKVLVVNWPVAHEPVGDCHNARYTKREFEDYKAWLRDAAAAEGLQFLDLHDALSSGDFFDSIHPNLRGQRRVADRIESALVDVLAERANAEPPR